MALVAALALCSTGSAETFSICAVDPRTGEVGSAGATCGFDVNVISDVYPGIGVLHAQAYGTTRSNRDFVGLKMKAGWSPDQIIDWLITHDADAAPYLRQYGIVCFNSKGKPATAAFTGTRIDAYKNQITGRTYSVQGNRLLGPQILAAMEHGFKHTKGTLAHKLMAAMQGANVPGADRGCLNTGLSSMSAFLIVAKPDDATPYINLIVPDSGGREPIDILQTRFDALHLRIRSHEKH